MKGDPASGVSRCFNGAMTCRIRNIETLAILKCVVIHFTRLLSLSCACSFDLGKMIIQSLISTLNVLAYAKYLYNLINSNAYERDVNKT